MVPVQDDEELVLDKDWSAQEAVRTNRSDQRL